ncbi:uncharacterized protein LOC134782934 [Penaeus indicus]|uniref:uncharacterized protein LOC134782934 n=1 Tax=Penaeus indicus TaxID=29960 RepID=UPI00300CB8D2
MFSILLIALVVAALGNEEESEGKRIAFLLISQDKYMDMNATFHLVSGNVSYTFEFRFLFSDYNFTASVSVNDSVHESRQLASLKSKIKHSNLLLEITLLKRYGYLLSLSNPLELLSQKHLFVVNNTEINSINEMGWKFVRIGKRLWSNLKRLAVSVAGEVSSERILKIDNDVERILNSTWTTKVNRSFEIRESRQGKVSSKSTGCVSFYFGEDCVCNVSVNDDCKVPQEIFPEDVEAKSDAEHGFCQQEWLYYLLALFLVGTIILAYLCPKGYFKPCAPYCSGHRSNEETHSNPAYSSTGFQSTDLPRRQEPAFPHGSLPRADGTSRESVNSEYFQMSDLARSPEAPAAGDCEGDANYSRLQHITKVPVLEGHYDSCL